MRFVSSVVIATLAPVTLALSASSALAANKDCTVLGEIASAVVIERQAGSEMNSAILAVAESYTGKNKRFQPAIPLLADWVYNLPEDQMGEEVGPAYQAACEAQ